MQNKTEKHNGLTRKVLDWTGATLMTLGIIGMAVSASMCFSTNRKYNRAINEFEEKSCIESLYEATRKSVDNTIFYGALAAVGCLIYSSRRDKE